jgi:chromosome segregation ATPase
MKMDASKKKVAKLKPSLEGAEAAKKRTAGTAKSTKKEAVRVKKLDRVVSKERITKANKEAGKAKTAKDAMKNKVSSTKTKINKIETDASSKKAVQKTTRKKAITGAKKAVTKAVKTGVKRLGAVGAVYTVADKAIETYYKGKEKKIKTGSQINSPKVNNNRVVHHTVFQAANRSKKN